MAKQTEITDLYLKRRLDRNQITLSTAIYGQFAIMRLAKFAGISINKILELPEQVVIDYLNSCTAISTYNSDLGFFKQYYRENEITTVEKHGKKDIERYYLSDMKKKRENESLLREKEQVFTHQPAIDAILRACGNTRDQVIVQVLLEYGFRRAEIASVQIRDVEEDPTSGGMNITCRVSKTKVRKVLGIESAAIIRKWIHKDHPLIDPIMGIPPKNAPFLCVCRGNRGTFGSIMNGVQIFYAFKAVRIRAEIRAKREGNVELANVIRKIHPHSFRHYATTKEIVQGIPDAMIKVRRGWSKDSKMIGRYTHVDEDDANAGYAAKQGIDMKAVRKKYTETPKQCPRCLTMNRASAKICDNCGSPLDVKEAAEMAQNLNEGKSEMKEMIELLKDPIVRAALKQIKNSH